MRRRAVGIALFALLVTPSAWLAWRYRAMPQLGFYHDDGIYWVCAKSLAQAGDYRIPSLPGQPFQTKYPPLFPALLAVVWKLSPRFPANLSWAVLLVWLAFPAYLYTVWKLYNRYGLGPFERWLLTAAVAMNPLVVLYSFSATPELIGAALLLFALLIAEKKPILGGLLAGLAYLAKSAALPLLVAVPVCLAVRREYRRAGMFVCAMLPAVAAWQVWVATHLSSGRDLVTLYYTNYAGFQRYNVPWIDLPRVIWYNLDAMLMAIGKLITFDIGLWESKHLERLVAVAAIAGVVRLARRTRDLAYPMFAGLFVLLLLAWHYPSDQRFVFPLYPLLLAGLSAELQNVIHALKTAWEKRTFTDRFAAAAIGLVMACFAAFVGAANLAGLTDSLPVLIERHAANLAAERPAYAWIAAHAPASSSIFAYDDTVAYLYTGRRALSLPIPTRYFYHGDRLGIDRLLDAIPGFAAAQGADYLLLTPADFQRDLHETGAAREAAAVRQSQKYEEVYRTAETIVYRSRAQLSGSLH